MKYGGTFEERWERHKAYDRRQKTAHREAKKIRPLIFARDRHKCRICGSVEQLTLDHITPLEAGGLTEEQNLWTLCFSCNAKKGAKLIPFQLKLPK